MDNKIENTEAEPMIIGEKETTIPLNYVFGSAFLSSPILFKLTGKHLFEINWDNTLKGKQNEN